MAYSASINGQENSKAEGNGNAACPSRDLIRACSMQSTQTGKTSALRDHTQKIHENPLPCSTSITRPRTEFPCSIWAMFPGQFPRFSLGPWPHFSRGTIEALRRLRKFRSATRRTASFPKQTDESMACVCTLDIPFQNLKFWSTLLKGVFASAMSVVWRLCGGTSDLRATSARFATMTSRDGGSWKWSPALSALSQAFLGLWASNVASNVAACG